MSKEMEKKEWRGRKEKRNTSRDVNDKDLEKDERTTQITEKDMMRMKRGSIKRWTAKEVLSYLSLKNINLPVLDINVIP